MINTIVSLDAIEYEEVDCEDLLESIQKRGVATSTTQEFQTFIEENRPAIEAWLTEAGQEVRDAWDTLVNAGQHTEQELEAAYETVTESLEEAAN